jgi:hypothetical protein
MTVAVGRLMIFKQYQRMNFFFISKEHSSPNIIQILKCLAKNVMLYFFLILGG